MEDNDIEKAYMICPHCWYRGLPETFYENKEGEICCPMCDCEIEKI